MESTSYRFVKIFVQYHLLSHLSKGNGKSPHVRESGKFLLVKSGILGFGIRDGGLGILDLDTQALESRIQDCLGFPALHGARKSSSRARSLLCQESITRNEQLPCARVLAFSRTSLFLKRFWREVWISFKFYKPVSKTYRSENNIFLPFNNV